MSYNGTGTFNINTAGQPVVTGTTITSTAFNLLTADLATGLTTALTKDGQTTPTANIPMGSFKITGLGAGTSATDAAQYGQLQAGATTIATVTGTDTLTGSVTPALAAYATGNLFSFVAASTNTGAATINLNSLGAKNITKQGTTALIAGDIASGRVHLIEYDGTRFQLLNPASSTGTGASVFATSPTLVTPTLGVATATSLQGIIGNVTPAAGTFTTVTGSNDASINGLTVGRGAGAVSTNTAVGASALAANSTGTVVTAVGYQAGNTSTAGFLDAFGSNAGGNITTGTENTSIGRLSMASGATAITGANNTAVGQQAMRYTSGSASYNTAVGYQSLANTTSSYNTAIGFQAAVSNTTGDLNTAIGRLALYTNTTGASNTAVGSGAMVTNSTGAENTAVGRDALTTNSTGNYNVAVGKNALNSNTTASNNTAVGYQAGYTNTTGTINTSLGAFAGYTNSTSNAVTAIGGYVLQNNTAAYNTGVGYNALNANTTGESNTAVGSANATTSAALRSNTTGSFNSAFGVGALGANTTASSNTAVGYQAGYSNTTNGANAFFGGLSGYNSTGVTNTYLGYGAGYSMTSGGKNVIIGGYNGNQSYLGDIRTLSNHIVLSDGDGVTGFWINAAGRPFLPGLGSDAGTNAVRFNTGTGRLSYDTSSARYKDNIRDSIYGLSHVMQMRSTQFEYKEGGRSDVGLIAEELQPIVPELVGVNKEGQADSVSYDRMVSVLVKAVQELKAEFDAYKSTHP